MIDLKTLVTASALGLLAAIPAFAQQPAQPGAPAAPASPPLPYGAPISYEAAKNVMSAAEAEAMKNNLPDVIAIVAPAAIS